MYKITILIALIVSSIFAIEIPIQQRVDIKLPLGVSIVELPFMLKNITISSFEYQKEETSEEIEPLQTELSPTKPKIEPVKDGIFDVKNGDNIIQISAKTKGSAKVVVWGYKYPMMLNIVIDDNSTNTNDYYKFVDYDTPKEVVQKLENDNHTNIIKKLINAIANNTPLAGYKTQIEAKEYEDSFFRYALVNSYIGNRYKVEKYKIKNITNETINLTEEMFYRQGVYGISIESSTLAKDYYTNLYIVSVLK